MKKALVFGVLALIFSANNKTVSGGMLAPLPLPQHRMILPPTLEIQKIMAFPQAAPSFTTRFELMRKIGIFA